MTRNAARHTWLWPLWMVILGLVVVFVSAIRQGPLGPDAIDDLKQKIEEQPLVIDSTIAVSGGRISLSLNVKPSTSVETAAILGDVFLRSVIASIPDALHVVRGAPRRVSFAHYFNVGQTTYSYSVGVKDGNRLIVSGSKPADRGLIAYRSPERDGPFSVRMPNGYRWPHPDVELPLPLN